MPDSCQTKGTKSYSCLALKAEIIVKHALFINCHWWIKAVNKKILKMQPSLRKTRQSSLLLPPLCNQTKQNNPQAPTMLGRNNTVVQGKQSIAWTSDCRLCSHSSPCKVPSKATHTKSHVDFSALLYLKWFLNATNASEIYLNLKNINPWRCKEIFFQWR